VHRDTDHAPDMARAQQVRALDLRSRGIVDRIVGEHPDAADEPEAFCRRLGAVLEHELAGLFHADPAVLRTVRARRFDGTAAGTAH
jgi:acetyl-CoA carboxylase carboxyl transferase subunit beta